ncbi:MAG: transcriptional repressor [Chloroflexi bacterium]|nr:transcriptional repressor [Chloroflexota bacterium]
MLSTEGILATLTENGGRETASRRLIAQAVAGRSAAFTAQEIYEELAPRGVGRATVFRTLNLLHERGLLNRLHIGEGCHSYTLCEPQHHHHLVCVRCGCVYPFGTPGDCTVVADVQRLAVRVGFVVEGHHVEVFGRCAECLST